MGKFDSYNPYSFMKRIKENEENLKELSEVVENTLKKVTVEVSGLTYLYNNGTYTSDEDTGLVSKGAYINAKNAIKVVYKGLFYKDEQGVEYEIYDNYEGKDITVVNSKPNEELKTKEVKRLGFELTDVKNMYDIENGTYYSPMYALVRGYQNKIIPMYSNGISGCNIALMFFSDIGYTSGSTKADVEALFNFPEGTYAKFDAYVVDVD